VMMNSDTVSVLEGNTFVVSRATVMSTRDLLSRTASSPETPVAWFTGAPLLPLRALLGPEARSGAGGSRGSDVAAVSRTVCAASNPQSRR
jgi:hypothetical protein